MLHVHLVESKILKVGIDIAMFFWGGEGQFTLNWIRPKDLQPNIICYLIENILDYAFRNYWGNYTNRSIIWVYLYVSSSFIYLYIPFEDIIFVWLIIYIRHIFKRLFLAWFLNHIVFICSELARVKPFPPLVRTFNKQNWWFHENRVYRHPNGTVLSEKSTTFLYW